jgi:uncharacterized protein (DUF433 family)
MTTNIIEQKDNIPWIAGTRISLYDVMDFAIDGYPAKFIANMLGLSVEQVQAALKYIDIHQSEVGVQYQVFLAEAAQLQEYWQQQNRELDERVANHPAPIGKEAAWLKLQEQKAKRLSSKL